jgi:hypothetical protein
MEIPNGKYSPNEKQGIPLTNHTQNMGNPTGACMTGVSSGEFGRGIPKAGRSAGIFVDELNFRPWLIRGLTT